MTHTMLVQKRELIPTDTSVNCQVMSANLTLWSFQLSVPPELKWKSFVQDSPCCTACRGAKLSLSNCIPKVPKRCLHSYLWEDAQQKWTEMVFCPWYFVLSAVAINLSLMWFYDVVFYMTFTQSHSDLNLMSSDECPFSLVVQGYMNGYMNDKLDKCRFFDCKLQFQDKGKMSDCHKVVS